MTTSAPCLPPTCFSDINISILPVLSSFFVPLSRMYWIKSRYCISSCFCVFTHGGSFITDVQVSEFALCISLTDSIFYDVLFFLKNKRKGFLKCLQQNNDFHFFNKRGKRPCVPFVLQCTIASDPNLTKIWVRFWLASCAAVLLARHTIPPCRRLGFDNQLFNNKPL